MRRDRRHEHQRVLGVLIDAQRLRPGFEAGTAAAARLDALHGGAVERQPVRRREIGRRNDAIEPEMRGNARRVMRKPAGHQINLVAPRPRRQGLVQHVGIIGQMGVVELGLRQDIRERRHARASTRAEAGQHPAGAGEQRFQQQLPERSRAPSRSMTSVRAAAGTADGVGTPES
ncbi:hypothetical protein ACVWZ3_008671 [Bradyrhizobium sp. i1.3.6]